MRIAVNGTHDAGTLSGAVAGAARAAADGFSGYWLGQAFGADALTALAIAAPEAPGIELGVAVVPIWSRTPQALASQALTTQAATGGRLTLGIGLSHRSVVEGMWGRSYTRTAARARDHLAVLRPLLRGEEVEHTGPTMRFAGRMLFEPEQPPPPVVLGALGSGMLRVAGELTEGTVIGSVGPATVADHIVPTITAAAAGAGRPAPRVIANVVAIVTDDRVAVHERMVERLHGYGQFPSFKAMLDREGVGSQADIALIGDEATVTDLVDRYEAAGVTDLVVAELGEGDEETARTRALFGRLARTREERP
jgi:F420-dependent oxidoreductase-like protein